MSATYYMGVKRPTVMRRHLLEAAKLSVQILKGKYQLRQLRQQKSEKIVELSEKLASLGESMAKLKETAPVHNPDDMPEVAKTVERIALRQEKQREASSVQTDLHHIKGIGPSTADKLGRAGVHTVGQLAEQDPAGLSALTGIPVKTSDRLISQAVNWTPADVFEEPEAPPIEVISPLEETKKKPKLETLDENLVEEEMSKLTSQLADIERKLNNL